MSRGFAGIGIYAGKSPGNLGGLWRSAHAFGAAYIFTVGCRYPDERQPSDTTAASRHVPLYEHRDWEHFLGCVPLGAEIVAVDCRTRFPETPLPEFAHPERAVYVLGAEDRGLLPGDRAERGPPRLDPVGALPQRRHGRQHRPL